MRRLSPTRLAIVLVALVAVLAAALWVTPSSSYIFLPDRAKPVEPLITIEGGGKPANGGVYFVDVFVRKATLLERLFPGLRSGSTVVPESAVRPPGVSEHARRRNDLNAMSRSQQIAAVVALRAMGFKVKAQPNGARVEQVIPGAPAAGRLQPGDVVVSAGGRPVRSPADLRRELARGRPGSTVSLGVRRDDRLQQIRLRTARDPNGSGRPVIGVLVEPEADIELPLDVKIHSGDIGGPSAGLPFALGIMEELGRDVDHGHRVAATGELQLDGTIEPIGGVEQKTIGVRKAGVDIFLVPAGDNAAEASKYADGVRIIPVHSFQQALRALATLPAES